MSKINDYYNNPETETADVGAGMLGMAEDIGKQREMWELSKLLANGYLWGVRYRYGDTEDYAFIISNGEPSYKEMCMAVCDDTTGDWDEFKNGEDTGTVEVYTEPMRVYAMTADWLKRDYEKKGEK